MDLRALLDEQVGDGPPQRSVAEDVQGGRRRVRRRRWRVGLGSVTVVAVLAGGGWAVSGPGQPTGSLDVVGPGGVLTTMAVPIPTPSDPPTDPSGSSGDAENPVGRPGDDFATFTAGGTFRPEPGVQVVEERSPVDLPVQFSGDETNVGVAHLRRGGRDFWALGRGSGDQQQVIVVPAVEVDASDLDGFLVWARAVYAGDSGAGLL